MNELVSFGEPSGQGWTQIIELATALVLCSLIGLERELKQKSAGLRTLTLVGLGAALFLLVSKYGFTDVLVEGRWCWTRPGSRRRLCPASASSAAA